MSEDPAAGGVTAAPLRRQNLPLTSIRGIAALWVVGHHMSFELGFVGYPFASALFSPGDAAVDIFFVLSGFVMTAVHRDLTRDGIGDFLTRRVFRVYPLHLTILAILAALALWAQLVHGHPPANPWWQLPLVAVLVHPIFILGPTWNIVSWSIGVEMLCYLLFPIAIPLLRRMELVGTALILLVLCVVEWHARSGSLWGWLAFKRGLAGFALGMVLQQMTVLLPRPGPLLASLVEVMALVGAVHAIQYWYWGIQYVPLFAALLIWALSSETGILAWVLRGGFFVWLGKISFSVYLTHATILFLAFANVMPAQLPFRHGAQGLIWAACVVAIICAVSTVTWFCVEEPARRYGARLARRRRLARA